MTKADLQELINLKNELSMWEEYREHLQLKSRQSMKTDKLAVSITETEEIISGFTEQMQSKIKECIKFIATVEKSDLRQAMFYRYIGGKNYVQIAMKLNTTEEAIRVKVKRYLNKRGIN